MTHEKNSNLEWFIEYATSSVLCSDKDALIVGKYLYSCKEYIDSSKPMTKKYYDSIDDMIKRFVMEPQFVIKPDDKIWFPINWEPIDFNQDIVTSIDFVHGISIDIVNDTSPMHKGVSSYRGYIYNRDGSGDYSPIDTIFDNILNNMENLLKNDWWSVHINNHIEDEGMI